MEKIEVLGVGVSTIGLETLLERIIFHAGSQNKLDMFYVNVHAINLAQDNEKFRNALNTAEIVFCDGYGVKLGASLLGFNIPKRYTPPDWIDDLCELSIRHDFSLFFLGTKQDIVEKAASVLLARHHGLNICGVHHGFFDKRVDSLENKQVLALIAEASPDILVVGFGMPLQEFWIMENDANISASVRMPVGAMFDYVAGEVKRAPKWMTDYGLEWLGRLLIEPRRLWQRYVIGLPKFFGAVLLYRFRNG